MADDVLPGDLADWPPELRDLKELERVIALLRSMPLPASTRRKKLYHWAKSLGAELDPAYYRRLET
jgi:hypothetical protein